MYRLLTKITCEVAVFQKPSRAQDGKQHTVSHTPKSNTTRSTGLHPYECERRNQGTTPKHSGGAGQTLAPEKKRSMSRQTQKIIGWRRR